MTTDGAPLVGLFPIDDKTIAWLEKRAKFYFEKRIGKANPSGHVTGNGMHPRIKMKERITELKNDLVNLQPGQKDAILFQRKTITKRYIFNERMFSGTQYGSKQ
jgi:hypothetical protein